MTNGFPKWCRQHIPPGSPAAVQKWFAARGLEMTREGWRKLLRPHLSEVRASTWIPICEVTREPLRTFIDYEPCGRPIRRPAKRRVKPKTAPPSTEPPKNSWNPPNPFAS
jgi:hypothetical protein